MQLSRFFAYSNFSVKLWALPRNNSSSSRSVCNGTLKHDGIMGIGNGCHYQLASSYVTALADSFKTVLTDSRQRTLFMLRETVRLTSSKMITCDASRYQHNITYMI